MRRFEGSDLVAIVVEVGSYEDPLAGACPHEPHRAMVRIELGQALEARTVVDAARHGD